MTFFGVPGQGLELYHIGLTVPDLNVAMERGGKPGRFSYHPFSGGLWIELVHTSFKAQLADWTADTLAGSG